VFSGDGREGSASQPAASSQQPAASSQQPAARTQSSAGVPLDPAELFFPAELSTPEYPGPGARITYDYAREGLKFYNFTYDYAREG